MIPKKSLKKLKSIQKFRKILNLKKPEANLTFFKQRAKKNQLLRHKWLLNSWKIQLAMDVLMPSSLENYWKSHSLVKTQWIWRN